MLATRATHTGPGRAPNLLGTRQSDLHGVPRRRPSLGLDRDKTPVQRPTPLGVDTDQHLKRVGASPRRPVTPLSTPSTATPLSSASSPSDSRGTWGSSGSDAYSGSAHPSPFASPSSAFSSGQRRASAGLRSPSLSAANPQRPPSRSSMDEFRARSTVPPHTSDLSSWRTHGDRTGPVRASRMPNSMAQMAGGPGLGSGSAPTRPQTPLRTQGGNGSVSTHKYFTTGADAVNPAPRDPASASLRRNRVAGPSNGTGSAPSLASAGQLMASATTAAAVPDSGSAVAPVVHSSSGLDEDQDYFLQEAIRESLQDAEDQAIRQSLAEAEEQAIRQSLQEAEEKAAAEKKGSEEDVTPADANLWTPRPPPKELARTFSPHRWLSDASITFGYSLLALGKLSIGNKEGKSNIDANNADSDRLPQAILPMDPDIAFWLTMRDDPKDLEEAMNGLKLHDRELVLCPINDNKDGSMADGGTHWSLLAGWRRVQDNSLDRNQQTSMPGSSQFDFIHYDSLTSWTTSGSSLQAKTLAAKLAGEPGRVSVGPCAKQTNCFDCGVYVLVFSEMIISSFLRMRNNNECRKLGAPPWDEQQLLSVTPEEVHVHREWYYKRCAAAAGAPEVALAASRTAAAGSQVL